MHKDEFNIIYWSTLLICVTVVLVQCIKSDTILGAVDKCSGSPACIESTVSVLMYNRTPCLDNYINNGN